MAKERMQPYQDVPGPTIDFTTTFTSLGSELKGANVLITGGASGIGKACARAFLEHGGYVTIADLDTPVLTAATKELTGLAGGSDRLQAVVCDVTDWSSQVKLFDSAAGFGPKGVIDVVMPCAGPRGRQFSFHAPEQIAPGGALNGLTESTFPPPPAVACIQVALIGMMYTCQLAVWHMARKKASLRCLIAIGSMTSYRGIAGNADYAGAKYGARGLFKTLRDASANLDDAADGPAVRLNFLCPGYVHTPFIDASVPELVKMGVKMASIESLVDGVLRMAADRTIHGKAIGVSGDGCFDIRDDVPGQNGVIAMNEQVWFSRQDDINRSRIGIW